MYFSNTVLKHLGHITKSSVCCQRRHLSQSSKLYSFFERDTRGAEYPIIIDKPWQEIVKESGPAFVQECKKLWRETKDHFQQDRKLYYHGDTDVFWRFDSEDCLKEWRIGSDKINKEGQSECSLVVNDKKKLVFSGNVDLTPPKDGRTRFAGYCGIRTVKKLKSFFRDDWYYFEPFTHLEMRVKGDGRNYMINLNTGMYYDVSWFVMYSYVLHTHGGPYWQVVRLPFSKFFLQSKGHIQDRQCPVPKDRINSIGITCAGVAGPFKLEIDYIGCHVDFRHTEKHAYEMYDIPKEFVSY